MHNVKKKSLIPNDVNSTRCQYFNTWLFFIHSKEEEMLYPFIFMSGTQTVTKVVV